jgi:cytoskeleton protein RodZ
VGTFGEKLQREREMRGITLEEIAEATKIGTRSLRALEEQDFDKLPGGIFNKGFVRAYAKYLGIDEEQSVADYVEAVDEAQAAGKLARPEVAPPAVAFEEVSRDPIRVPWELLIGLALVVAVVFAARSYYAKHGWQKLARQPVAAEPARAPAAAPQQIQPVATMPVTNPSAPDVRTATTASAPENTPSPEVFEVKVRATELSWVEIDADGKRVLSENLAANAERSVRASKEVVIRTGNAGGIEVSQNDKVLPPIGPKHEVRTVTVTAQGIKEE